MTLDLDLVVDLDHENVTRLVDVLAREGYRPRLPVPLTDLDDETKRDDWVANPQLDQSAAASSSGRFTSVRSLEPSCAGGIVGAGQRCGVGVGVWGARSRFAGRPG